MAAVATKKAPAIDPAAWAKFSAHVVDLDAKLTLASFLSGSWEPNDADVTEYDALKKAPLWPACRNAHAAALPALSRWWEYMGLFKRSRAIPPAAVGKPSAKSAARAPASDKTAASAVSDRWLLPGAPTDGSVLTRFPPEASGFLHIGHAKAAVINREVATRHGGRMLLRFDDTNPAKEDASFEQAILDDLASLGIRWDIGPVYSSDHFDRMLQLAGELVGKGLAYCDFTPRDEMRAARTEGRATPCRAHTVEENKALWDEMVAGTERGQRTCLRAKISVDNPNKAMRDPVLYRVNVVDSHVRTGRKYNAYPTYDFACPVIDSLDGVTHAMRTSEYHDRDAQYAWVLEATGLRAPRLDDYSRLNLEYTVMSKRKLTEVVRAGKVDGWGDPRMPTVRGLLGRGLTVAGLREFVDTQGMSKVGNLMEWQKLWALNARAVDAASPRIASVAAETAVPLALSGPGVPAAGTLERAEVAAHKKVPELGMREVWRSATVLLDAADCPPLKEGEEVTLMNWGNARIDAIERRADGTAAAMRGTLRLDGDVKSTTWKLHWVPDPATAAAAGHPTVPAVLHEYLHLLRDKKPADDAAILECLAPVSHLAMPLICDPWAAHAAKAGGFVQLERRGFARVRAAASPLDLILVPDGKEKPGHLTPAAAAAPHTA